MNIDFNLDRIKKATARNPETSKWQQLLNLGYHEWQKPERQAWHYRDMIDWVGETYGDFVKLCVLLGKYNQQVCNGGHIQYFDNGYADGQGGFGNDHDADCSLHQELVGLFVRFRLHQTELGAKIGEVLNRFHIEEDYPEKSDEEEENCGLGFSKEVVNEDELDKLDQAYYAVCQEWEKWMEDCVNEWFSTGQNPIPAAQDDVSAPLTGTSSHHLRKPRLQTDRRGRQRFQHNGARDPCAAGGRPACRNDRCLPEESHCWRLRPDPGVHHAIL